MSIGNINGLLNQLFSIKMNDYLLRWLNINYEMFYVEVFHLMTDLITNDCKTQTCSSNFSICYITISAH